MQINFFIPMQIPNVTQQTHKITTVNGRPRIYEPAELRAARQLFRDHLAKHRPDQPLEGPVELSVYWCYPATKEHPEASWKTTKPDTDNLVKMLKDEMTRLGFWKDDAQVCAELLNKLYDRVPGVWIVVAQLGRFILDDGPDEDRDPGDEVCERSHTLLADSEPVSEEGGEES